MRVRTVAIAALLSAALPVAAVQPAAAAGADGTVLAFGVSGHFGSTDRAALSAPLVGVAALPSGTGYWLVSDDGGVFSFGAAAFHGSAGALRLRQPVVGVATTPSGRGYWLVARDGGIFAFGDAGYFGSTGGQRLNQPVIGMAPTPTGAGYWLVAADGGVFAFGDAGYFGSTGALRLNQPVVGMAATPSGRGYWLVGRDGGIFAFGDARFAGSTGGTRLNQPIAAVLATPSGAGYWLVAADAGVFSFGDAPFHGSGVGQVPRGKVVVGAAVARDGRGYWMVTERAVLAPGSLGASVEAVQRRLNDLGYWVPVDGRFTEVTRQAVYALEKAAGLPRRGEIGAAERQALEQGVRPVARSGPGTGRVVELDKARQLLLVVDDGRVQWAFNTSTGNGARYNGGRSVAVTPEGRFRIYRAINGMRVSDLGELYRPRYFTGGYAIHGSPSIPPYPASHGCARVSNAAINFIWDADLMRIGTPVWVYS